MHRPTRGIGSVFIAAGALVAAMLVPVAHAAAVPTPALDPISGPVVEGTTVDVHGTDFDANTQLAVWLDTDGNNTYDTNEPIAPSAKDGIMPPYRVTTASDGSFSTKLLVDHVAAGHFAVVAAPCSQGDDDGWNVLCGGTTGSASTPLDVALGLSESHFGSGQHVTVSAVDLPANTTATVWFDHNNNGVADSGETSMTPTTAGDGSASTDLTVTALPGEYQIGVTADTTTFFAPIHVDSCFLIDECMINDVDTQCLIGFAPTDPFADCKQVDSNYSDVRPETAGNTPPGGYDLSNVGVRYAGVGVLAALTNTFGLLINPASLVPTIPELAIPGTGCFAMQAAIAAALAYGNTVPDAGWDLTKPLTDLTDITCGNVIPPTPVSPPIPINPPFEAGGYITANEVIGHSVPDKPFILAVAAAIIAAAGAAQALSGVGCAALAIAAGQPAVDAALGAGVDAVTAASIGVGITGIVAGLASAVCLAPPPTLTFAILGAVQQLFAVAAVAGGIACGHVDYFCAGSDITATSIGSPAVQRAQVPVPIASDFTETPGKPNPCRDILSPTQRCWGQLIGWAQVACTSGAAPSCEDPDRDSSGNVITPLTYSHLPVPGSAGPDNVGAPIRCATGTVQGLSIGFDGDVSFDVNDSPDEHVPGPNIRPLVNYHNFLPGPGGSEAPNGIDIEIPVAHRPLFLPQITKLRKGAQVTVCGHWVADMHQLWNELHPIVSLQILESDLSLTKTATTPAVAGGQVSFDLHATNNGPSDAGNVTVTDPLPAGTTFASVTAPPGWNCTAPAVGAGGTVACTTDHLANGNDATITLAANVAPDTPDGTLLVNHASVSSPATDPSPQNNSASSTSVVSTKADIAIAKSGPAAGTAGTNVSYTVTVTNNGPSNAKSVTWNDTLGAGSSLVSLTQASGPAFTCKNVPAQCTTGTLASGASASFTVLAHLNSTIPNATTLCNSAGAVTATSDPDTSNNLDATCATIETHADLTLTKSGPTNAIAGTNASYALSIANAGPSDAQDVLVSDPLPAGASLVSVTQNSGPLFACGGGTGVQCIRASLASGAAASFTFVVHFSPSVPDGSTRCSTAAIQSGTTDDPNPTNNSATTCTTVAARADLTLAQQVTTTGSPGNGAATFTFALRNLGPSDSQGVTFVAGVRFKVAPLLPPQVISSGANCSVSGFVVTCRWPTIAFAATQTFTITVKWRSAVGQVCNDASVTSATIDPDATNNTATLCTAKK